MSILFINNMTKFNVPGVNTAAIVPEAHGLEPQVLNDNASSENAYNEKDIVHKNTSVSDGYSDSDIDEKVDLQAQYGTQAAQAMTLVWTRGSLITSYIMYVYLGVFFELILIMY